MEKLEHSAGRLPRYQIGRYLIYILVVCIGNFTLLWFVNILKSLKCAAAEVSYSKNQVVQNKEAVNNGITASIENIPALDRHDINHNQIRTRLRHLECELNTALDSLRSKREEYVLDKVCLLLMHNSFYPVTVDSISFGHSLQSMGINKNTVVKACRIQFINYYI